MKKRLKLKFAENIIERELVTNRFDVSICYARCEEKGSPSILSIKEDFDTNRIVEPLSNVLSSRIIDDGFNFKSYSSGAFKQISTKIYETKIVDSIYNAFDKIKKAIGKNKSDEVWIPFNALSQFLTIVINPSKSEYDESPIRDSVFEKMGMTKTIDHTYISQVRFTYSKIKKKKRNDEVQLSGGVGKMVWTWYGYESKMDDENESDCYDNEIPNVQTFKKYETKFYFSSCNELEILKNCFTSALEIAMKNEPVNSISDIRYRYKCFDVNALVLDETRRLHHLRSEDTSNSSSVDNDTDIKNEPSVIDEGRENKKYNAGEFEDSCDKNFTEFMFMSEFVANILKTEIPLSCINTPLEIKYRSVQDIFRRRKITIYDNFMMILGLLDRFSVDGILSYRLELGEMYYTRGGDNYEKHPAYIHFDFTDEGKLMVVFSYYSFDNTKKFGISLNKIFYVVDDMKDMKKLIKVFSEKVKYTNS